MLLDNDLLMRLLSEASSNARLRTGCDLRTTVSDTSQRMINMLLPGTVVPIHRHTMSAETVIVVSGRLDEVFYDNAGNETERFHLAAGGHAFGLQIPVGQWHTVAVSEPCAIIEIKDGAYEPLSQSDVLR